MSKISLAASLLFTTVLSSSVALAQTNHGDFSGVGVDFLQVTETTQTPGDPPELWEAPTQSPIIDGLFFSPGNFISSCQNGGSNITASLLTTEIVAQPGNSIDSVMIVETGDAILTSFALPPSPSPPPGTNASASMSGFLTVTEPTVEVIPFSGTFDQDFFTLPGDLGTRSWRGEVTIDVKSVVPNATRATLSLDNVLDSNCAVPEFPFFAFSAAIQKKTVGGPSVALMVNPEPCDLILEKTCCIPPTPAPGVDVCEGKVLSATFQVVGGDCSDGTNDQEGKAKCSGFDPVPLDTGMVDVTVLKDENKIAVNGDIGGTTGVPFGGFLTFTNEEDFPDPKELKASTKFSVTGPQGMTQELTIHTSCSKALRCNDQFGSLRLTSITTTEGGTKICPDPDSEGTQCVEQTAPPFTCEDKISSITFQWTGDACPLFLPNSQGGKAECDGTVADAEPVSVRYIGGDADKISVSPSSNICIDPPCNDPPNETDTNQFTLTATGRDDLKASTKLLIEKLDHPDKGVVQTVEIHTSCSKPIDCGDEFGGLKVVKIMGTDGTVCDSTPPGPLFQDACQVPLTPPTPHCTSKLNELKLVYIGDLLDPNDETETCTVTNPQDGKGTCSGVDDPGTSADVTITKDDDKVFADPELVSGFGSIFTIFKEEGGVRKELASSTEFDVTGPNGTQSIAIHTSCSKPLNLGDVFGSFAVFGMDRTGDGFISLGGEVEYQYTVTNPNDADALVTLEDDQLMDPVADGETVPANDFVTFYRTQTLYAETTNTATLMGSVGDLMCTPVEDSVTVEVNLPPQGSFDCSDAKPIDELTMTWNGTVDVHVKAWDGDVGGTLLVDTFASDPLDPVEPDENFAVSGMGGSPNDQFWEIFDATDPQSPVKIGESNFHISCSDSGMNGIEDCFDPQGDGKNDDASLINDWGLEGMSGDQTLDCTPDPIVLPPFGFVGSSCGLGFELVFLLPGLLWLRGRRRRMAA